MKEKINKIWKDPVGATLISAGVLALLGWLGDKLTDGWVLSALKTVWGWINVVLFFEIAVIWIIIGVIVIISIIYIYLRASDSQSPQNKKPDFLSYTEDTFNGYKYSWDWDYSKYYGKYSVGELSVLCSECETPMMWNPNVYYCPRCNKKVEHYKLKLNSDIEAIIVDNIKRNTYDKK